MPHPTESTHREAHIGPAVQRGVPQWTATLAAAWSYPILRPLWMRTVLLAAILGVCVLRGYIGVTGSQAYSHDLFMFLDGAWRMINGQLPHVDFYSHLGILAYAPTVVGLWMARGTAVGFAYAQALVALILGLWSYLLSRRYLGDVACSLMSFAVVLMAAATSALGDPPGALAPAVVYNRQGYALLAIILIEAFGRTGARPKRDEILGSSSTGVALALLLFLKITYFVFGLFLLTALTLLFTRRKRHWASLVLSFATASICFCVYLRFQLGPMFSDLIGVAGAKRFHWWWFGLDSVFQDVATAAVFVIMAALLLLASQQRESARIVALGGLATCATGLLIFGNHEQSGFPMAVFLAIIVIDLVSRIVPVGRAYSLDALYASVFLLGFVLILTSLGSGTLSLSHSIGVKLLRAPQYRGLDTPLLQSFVPIDGDELYGEFVNDGLHLLRKYRKPGETVMSLDFTNPFSYGLSIKPAPGGTTVLQYNTTFSDKHRQSAESLFGSADLVMLPQHEYFSDSSLQDSIVPLYGKYLNSHFTRIAQTKYWQLYRRNSSVP